MVTRSEAFPSRYWKASDLPQGGKAFKIAKLQLDKVGLDQSEKYVLFLKGEDKQLILNITNWDAIAAICGADSDQWTGKEIVMFPTQTTFGGKTVDCIRVRRPRPPQAKVLAKPPPPQPPQSESEEPPADDDGDPGWQPDAVEVEVEEYRV